MAWPLRLFNICFWTCTFRLLPTPSPTPSDFTDLRYLMLIPLFCFHSSTNALPGFSVDAVYKDF